MPTDSPLATAKAAMRAEMRQRRARFAAAHGDETPLPLPPHWLVGLSPGPVIASYRPIGGEIDPTALEAPLRIAGAMIAYPRVESADAPLSFRLVREESDWEAGPHRIRQPGAHTPAVRPALILMPLLAFDRAGRRLGQGGGYYDRTLAAMPDVRTVGLAWSVQETDDIPTESWDRPLNAIVTEKEWIEP